MDGNGWERALEENIEHGGTHLPSWLLEGLRQVGGKVEAGGPARRPC